MTNRRLVVTTTALSILMSLSLSTASRADGNPQTYLNDPLFVELAADMAYTSSLISDESKQLSISVDQMMYDINAVPTLMVTQSLSISANNVAGTATINGWDAPRNTWSQTPDVWKVGYANNTTYTTIQAADANITKAALKRLKKQDAKWLTTVNSSYQLSMGAYDPTFIRLAVLGQLPIASMNQVTMNGKATISNIVVYRDTPSTGMDTFSLTSEDSSRSVDTVIVVNSERVVTSSTETKYHLNNTRGPVEEVRIVSITDRSQTTEVASLMGAHDVKVDNEAFTRMYNVIASELTVTPKARSIATKAGLLAKAAKGKSRNVVTAKVIQNAAKALKIGAIKTASGIKLAGEVQSQNVKGYMCVSVVKKKAVVKSC